MKRRGWIIGRASSLVAMLTAFTVLMVVPTGAGAVVPPPEDEETGVRDESDFLNKFFSYKWGTTGANLPGGDTATKPPDAVGFKLKYSQADVYPKVFDFLTRQRRDIRVVHLVRENLLASLCSASAIPFVLKYFNRPNVPRHQSLKGFSPRFRLDTTTLLSRLRELENLIQQSRDKMRQFECLEIAYEALVSRERSVTSQVLDFLRVPPETQLCSKYQKILPFDLARLLDNMDEVRSVLSGTKYEKFLTSSCD